MKILKKLALGWYQTQPARRGSFVGKSAVLMPCYVNIGAYIDEGTMMDTFSRAGSCCQIGKNCHISAGTGVGGVLEPAQASANNH